MDLKKRKSTRTKIAEWLMAGGVMTSARAYTLYGTTELRVYIADLRKKGLPIEGTWVTEPNGYRYKEYHLA